MGRLIPYVTSLPYIKFKTSVPTFGGKQMCFMRGIMANESNADRICRRMALFMGVWVIGERFDYCILLTSELLRTIPTYIAEVFMPRSIGIPSGILEAALRTIFDFPSCT